MSLLRKPFSSLLPHARRIPTLANSRRCGVRANSSRSGSNHDGTAPRDHQSYLQMRDSTAAPNSSMGDLAGDLENIADQIDAARASGSETVVLAPEPEDEEPPPRAPNSEEQARREEERKAGKKGKGKIRSPFAMRGDGLYRLSAQCTNNNTILTLADRDGRTKYQISGGMCGFKHVQRSTYEAGYQCAVQMFKKISEEQEVDGTVQLEICLKGRGMGREALTKALTMSEGEAVRRLVVQMTDRTPIKIGGTKAKKARRL